GNQMKTMTDGGVELGATTTDRALARAAHELDSMDVKQDASYGSMGGALLMTLLLVGGSLVAIVLLYVGFKAVDNSANPSGAAAIVMIVGGYGMIVIGEIWIKVIAFMEGALHGVLCLVCEIYELYFIATHFGDCLFPFGMIVGGSLMVSIGMVTASMNAGPGGVSEIPMMTEYLGTWLAMQGYSHDSNASTILATS
ncbi:MAG: hypothetical protein QGG36_10505, partial [Pirellulaceae bacterium]|nr:hypothetical protein [Pirellulaceae bacterium]